MAHFVIDLMGNDEDIVTIRPEDPDKKAREEEARKRFLEELFRRAPQPQVIPVEG